MFKQEKTANFVQVEGKSKPTRTFTSSEIELKYILLGKSSFKGLVDTRADLRLLRQNIYLKLGE